MTYLYFIIFTQKDENDSIKNWVMPKTPLEKLVIWQMLI